MGEEKMCGKTLRVFLSQMTKNSCGLHLPKEMRNEEGHVERRVHYLEMVSSAKEGGKRKRLSSNIKKDKQDKSLTLCKHYNKLCHVTLAICQKKVLMVDVRVGA
jgi:hypothetical protein